MVAYTHNKHHTLLFNFNSQDLWAARIDIQMLAAIDCVSVTGFPPLHHILRKENISYGYYVKTDIKLSQCYLNRWYWDVEVNTPFIGWYRAMISANKIRATTSERNEWCALRLTFEPSRAEFRACSELLKLKQGKRDIHSYILIHKSPYDIRWMSKRWSRCSCKVSQKV